MIRNIGIITTIIMIFAACQLQAQSLKDKVKEKEKERSSTIKQLVKGRKIISNGKTYFFLPEVRSAQTGKVTGDIESDVKEVLEKGSGNVIYKTKGTETKSPKNAALSSVSGINTYPVVLNDDTGKLGVISGNITVSLHDVNNAEAIANSHSIMLIKKVLSLSVCFYSVKPGNDIFSAADRLENDSRVKSVSIEIIEHFNEPH